MKNKEIANTLNKIYDKLYAAYGPQNWWPANSPFEVIVGAILTQNTAWKNVERAIANLKTEGLIEPLKLRNLDSKELAELIRPAGYFNIKTKRLKAFLNYLHDRYDDSLKDMFNGRDPMHLRAELLSINGIGMETADSILLYAGHLPIFVVDAYTRRILVRHSLISESAGYRDIQCLFMGNLRNDERLFNEYHALIVRVGKDLCRRSNPLCRDCPLM